MGFRRKARELALQLLFQMEFNPERGEGLLQAFWRDHEAVPQVKEFTELLVRGVLDHLPEIDKKIEERAEHWTPNRMATVDRNILRIAIFELCYMKDIPVRVSINEAIEVAKRFGNQESSAFINGILDRVLKETTEKEYKDT
jgi:N utilization substance protein B